MKRDSSFTLCKNNLKNILLKNNSIEFIHIDILDKDDFSIKTKINIKFFEIPLIKKERKVNENSLKNITDNSGNLVHPLLYMKPINKFKIIVNKIFLIIKIKKYLNTKNKNIFYGSDFESNCLNTDNKSIHKNSYVKEDDKIAKY